QCPGDVHARRQPQRQPVRTAGSRQEGRRQMKRIVEAIPYARFLGVEVERSDGALECILPFRREIVGNPALPAVLGAFLELTALLHLLDDTGSERVPKPITFSVDYLRSTGPFTTRARAELFKLGRRIANVRV